MISKIRAYSAVFYTFFVIPIAIFLMFFFRKYHRKVRILVAKLFMKLFNVPYKVEGVLDKEARILVMNHQSFMDVIYLEAFHPNDICWIAKKELGEPFFYGHALKIPQMILVDRQSKKQTMLLREAKKRLQEGRVLCIFPEGTRSLGGESFLPFKNGAKFLVEHFKLKIQPVVFCRTRACFDVGAMKFDRVPFEVRYLPAFLPSGEDWYERLRENMQQEYLKLYCSTNSKKE